MSDEGMLVRTFDASLAEEGDGRTLVGRCVPYNTVATVSDGGPAYQEMFVKGAFSRATKAPNRVYLNFEHKPGISNVLGHGVEFDERDDGLYGKLRVDDGAEGEKALRLYRDGVLASLSVEFKPMAKPQVVDGVTVRSSVHLDAVALCRVGAYEEAKVLALRTGAPEEDPVLPTPEPLSPALAMSLSRWLDKPQALLLARGYTTQEWDPDPARWVTVAAYAESCAIDDNPPASEKVRTLCHLPYREPDGRVNVHAVRAALESVDDAPTTDARKATAKQMFERMLDEYDNRPQAA